MTEQQTLRSDTSDSSPKSEEIWRNEIQAKLARYRTRRGRRIEGTYSMRFPFPADEEEAKAPQSVHTDAPEPQSCVSIAPGEQSVSVLDVEVESSIVVADDEDLPNILDRSMGFANSEPVEEVEVASSFPKQAPQEAEPAADSPFGELILEPDTDPVPLPPPRPVAKRKVIAFPRPATPPEEVYRLADPITPEQPRILDVPEELEPFPTTPLLEGLQLPAAQHSAPPSPDHVELPFQAVNLSRRVSAGIIDCAVVAAAAGLFGAVAYKLLPNFVPSKPVIATLAVLPVLFWAVYQYILLMYAGKTAGMQLTKIRLSTFKGAAPNWRYRRSRVLSLYFSTASMMMGLLWGLVDVDALCWHDRISRTYLTRRQPL